MSRTVILPPDRQLPDGSVVGGWWHDAADDRIVCDLCPRACSLKPGDRGFCFVRENHDGQMVLSTYGRSTGFCIDPIEKKPLNHFLPGTSILSFGTAGCNLGCKFCQNWSISKSREVQQLSEHATPEMIARAAESLGCHSVAFTYNDPVIWAEYAIDTARACHARNVRTVAVTAGYISPTARRPFFDVMDAANIDLKAFTELFYQKLTLSHLQPVLDTLVWLRNESDVWIEITNLVIPHENDGDEEFRRMCQWVVEHLGDQVPLHFTAFHPDFRLRDRESTPLETLLRAREIALNIGIKYAYVGNVDDEQHQSTYCPNCHQLLIQRNWYEIGHYALHSGCCSYCGTKIAGRFADHPGNWGRKRLPVRIADFAPDPSGTIGRGRQTSSPHGENSNMNDTAGRDTSTTEASQFTSLTAAQQTATIDAVSEIVRAAACGDQPVLADPDLSGAASLLVDGCFVSIKRQGRLRGCCGFVGRRTSLLQAIQESAINSTLNDARMPRVSPSELPFLEFETWLLDRPRPVEARGEDRIGAIQIGKHGLQIAAGESRGLLLPGVAVDLGADAEEFLQQVCLKAGLPPTAWREDDTRLWTFEGKEIVGRFSSPTSEFQSLRRTSISVENLQQLAGFCRDNLVSLLRGAVPNYYQVGLADGEVNGIVLQVNVADSPDAIQVSQLSLRNTLPIQSTLFRFCETIATRLQSEGRGSIASAPIRVNLAILSDPAMHGTVSHPDTRGIEPRERAVLIAQGSRSAWRYDSSSSAEAIVEATAKLCQVMMPDSAAIYSFATISTASPITVQNVPRPVAGPELRPAAVAGRFYPADANELQQAIESMLPEEPVTREAWRAAMVPHAGWVYSGRIAVDVLRRIEFPKTILVIGPKHTSLGVDWSVAPHAAWSIPGGQIESDRELSNRLCDEIDGLLPDSLAHQQEHGIEVELPLIRRFAPDSKVVGIAMGNASLEQCQRFGQQLAGVLSTYSQPVLLVISSDMNHYASDAETRRVDALAIEALKSLDPEHVFRTVRNHHISMCGVLPACVVLACLQQMQPISRCQTVAYGTSGDVSRDYDRVVGYAGMLFR